MRKLLSLTLALACCMSAFAQQTNPQDALKTLNEMRDKLFDAFFKDQKNNSLDGIEKQVSEKAREFVKGVDPKTIKAQDGMDWGTLFAEAKDYRAAVDLTNRYLDSNPDEKGRAGALMSLMNYYFKLGEGDNLLATFNKAVNAANAPALASEMAYEYADVIAASAGPAKALEAAQTVMSKLSYPDGGDERRRAFFDRSRVALAGKIADLLVQSGRSAEVQPYFDEVEKKMDKDSAGVKSLGALRVQYKLIGNPAPALTPNKAIGTFPGFDAWKGKVVVVDFFAHWCGPCKASFPDMKQMYADLHEKGLEIVGVTSFYGYFGQEKNLTADQEFGKMQDDFMAEHKLPWPVAFVPKADFAPFGVSGIPHAVVIDKHGNVHKIHVGYSADLFAAFRKEIEKLLAE